MLTERVQQLISVRWSILLAAIAIVAMGIYNLESSARSSMPGLYLTQLAWLGIGVAVALCLAAIDQRYPRAMAFVAYALVVVLLLLVLAKGRLVSGSRRWLHLGFFNVQPSELMKLIIIVTLASYLGARDWRERFSIRSLTRPLNLSRPLALLALILFKWQAPLLSDPLGVLARAVSGIFQGEPPAFEERWWLRGGLLLVVSLIFGAVVWWRYMASRSEDLLHPATPGAYRRFFIGAIVVYLLAVVGVLAIWDQPLVSDPFGTIIRALLAESAPAGRLAAPTPGYGFRIGLMVLLGLYTGLCALVIYLRGWQGWDDLIAPVDVVAVPAVLILVEPDLGTTIILLAVAGVMFLYVGIRKTSLLILALIMVLGSGVAWAGFLKPYQKQRIITFMRPEDDAKGAGYHSIQSLIAVGSGQVWGKGHGMGTQTQLRFLPEQHTDFAFSVWSEEMGFMGCLVLIAAYLVLLLDLLWAAGRVQDKYGGLLCVGTAALIFWHMVVNMGMVTGLLPVVGVTLPLFSYGGSSLITIMAAIGVAIAATAPQRTF